MNKCLVLKQEIFWVLAFLDYIVFFVSSVCPNTCNLYIFLIKCKGIFANYYLFVQNSIIKDWSLINKTACYIFSNSWIDSIKNLLKCPQKKIGQIVVYQQIQVNFNQLAKRELITQNLFFITSIVLFWLRNFPHKSHKWPYKNCCT